MRTKRVLLLMAVLAAIGMQCYSQTVIGRQRVDQYPTTAWGTLTYGLTWLPNDYNTNTGQHYPLIIFLHGSGEGGTTVGSLNNLLVHGLPKRIAAGWDPQAVNPATGQSTQFIVVSPQAPGWSYAWGSIQWILPDVISRYRIDTNRIYVTGISAGGAGTISCVTNGPVAAQKFAAVVPVSAAGTNSSAEADQIPLIGGTYGKKLWAIAGANESWLTFSQNMVTSINNAVPPPAVPAVLAPVPGGDHNSITWDSAYSPTWRPGVTGKNIYEWMLQWTNTNTPPPSPVQPTAHAGASQTITLPATSVTLNGSGTAVAPNTIASYAWSQVSGPSSYTIVSPGSASTQVTGLVPGTYVFRLTVTDNIGGTGSSNVSVTVVNPAPAAHAGADQYFALPLNSATLNGSGSDPDGSITTYQWNKIGGPSTYTLSNAASSTANLSNLVAGSYLMELVVTDNHGATGRDTMSVNVSPAPNTAPSANAGADVAITLPVNAVTLNGGGTDADGTIASYHWVKIAGPASFVLTSPNAATTGVNGLAQGVYQFELTVTDNGGATGKDTVQVTVNAAPNTAPAAHAGPDQSITLPVDSAQLSGSGTDSDGSIAGYQWTQVSGPSSASIHTPSQAQTVVGNLTAGMYRFRLSVTDNAGASASDTMMVTVNAAANIPPAAHAGNDTTITLPLDSILLQGNATDADGPIASLRWRKISGPSGHAFSDSTLATTWAHGLTTGVYRFEFSATDTANATAVDTVQVTVLAAPVAPLVFAGSDTTITLPVDSLVLNGSATDPDGTITWRRWRKISGPATHHFADSTQAQTVVDSLSAGVYRFQLSAMDNDGLSAADTIQVTVLPNPSVTGCGGVKRYLVPSIDGGRFISATDPNFFMQINPGDTIVLRSQYNWSYFAMTGYNGTPGCPIVVMNEGGQTWLTAGIEVKTCTYVKLTGSGHPATQYGFKIYKPGDDGAGVAISIVGRSKNVEVDRFDVYRKTYGVWAKQDPTCDPAMNYPSFRMDSVEIHHSRFRNIGQDGIYAGNTDPLGLRTVWCNGQETHPIPMRLSNINIHHLVVDSCNRTAIQLCGADSGYNQIHHNIITGAGFEFNQQQGFGIAIGGMTRNCHVFNNDIKNTFLYGIVSFGVGTNYIENNRIDSSGFLNGQPNTYSRPVNILASPKTTLPFDSTRIIIRNNIMGVNATTDSNNIALVVWGPPTWAAGNVVCNNTRLSNGAPSLNYIDPSIDYTANCSQVLGNMSPVAHAGPDQQHPGATDSVQVAGSGSDPDGSIVAYRWHQVSGPVTALIDHPDSAATSITGLVPGVYVFRLKVTDNGGLAATDDIVIRIAPPNVAPIANAGPDQTLTLPIAEALMNGGGTDPDGSIVSYQWSFVSGPASYQFANAGDPLSEVNSLTQGIYKFALTVTDDSGAIARDTMVIRVNPPSPAGNLAPIANAGTDITIGLPTNSVTLNGSGSDPDGTVTAYRWTRISGPTQFFMSNNTAPQCMVFNLTQGVYLFELRVTDDQGAVGRDTIRVTVNASSNAVPVVNAGSDQVITLPANSANLNGVAVDPDGTISFYQWTKLAGPASFSIQSPSSAQTAVANLVTGVYTFELQAADNHGAISRDTMQITVNPPPPPPANVAPVANAGIDQTITLPASSVTLLGSGTDADGTIASYQWTGISGAAGYTITQPSSAQTGINGLVAGTYRFELTVTDNSGASGKDTVQITVNPAPNQAPFAFAGADQTITLPTNGVALTGNGIDADGSITAYAWSVISGPSTYTFTSANTASTGFSGLVQGVYQVQLTVTDNAGATAMDTVIITVHAAPPPPPNAAPFALAGSDQAITLPTNSIVLQGTGVDVDGTIASYQWTKISGPTLFLIGNTSAAQTPVTNLQQGIYEFELQVTDNAGATGRDTVRVTVNPAVNLPPAANAGADVVITLPVNTAVLNGSGTDADGTIVSYQWVKISGPASFVLTSPSAAATSITGLVEGVYRFELTVTDNGGATGKDTVQVTVHPAPVNIPPVAHAGMDQTITLPVNSVSLVGSGSDPDGSLVAYQWAKISGPNTFTIVSVNQPQTQVNGLTQGVYRFELTVTDNSGATAKDTVQITVQAVPNVAPVANAGPDQQLHLPMSTTILHGIGIDADGTIASYQWRKIGGPNFFNLANANAAQTSVNALVQGTYLFELRVVDNLGAEGRDTMIIVVHPTSPSSNQRPIVNAGTDQTLFSPVSVAALQGSAQDPDGVVVGFSWTKISGPSSFTITNPSSAQTSVANLVEGVYLFELKAMDNNGAIGRDTVQITVQPNTISFSSATVYPNPGRSLIHLKIAARTNRNDTEVRIYDMRGRLVHQEQFVRNQHIMVRTIDVSKLPAGTYVIVAEVDINNDMSVKFIKE